ncbi:sigma-54 interaction domain-containing protein [Desulfobaculum bizertense]|uniref:PAS domain S-box-containing protein n=1 Tax=Desulfobaculum bizertense DSM 18034 TaxID=1121442 RepID=A0A1T4VTM5_9BACT|nr:sigma 54-interacting transcriptional regulator [Desulfobaculum bizertense]UIJ38465.1 sigma 54-interacting transcriptional regulator [Desulfobaculum bizertense]SKA68350.1 PAS domain S-box-containing protein [Desulfobaculum bizertense DSM 18034]
MTFPEDLPSEAILNSIADGVFTVDLDWNITFFNQAAARITGVSREEALGQKCWEVFHSTLCDGDCALRACVADSGSISNRSIFIVRPDGEKIPISISAAPLYDNENKVIGGVETFRDLTDIHLLRKEMQSSYSFEDIVGKSRALGRTFRILPQIAKSEATVLLLGESGTGKELFARALHTLSSRANGPFVAVNCGALPDTLLESELFGYKAGAFTDAKRDRAGRFETARGGTIFLDEIGDMPQQLQVKLLRVLQDMTYEPLGSERSVKADVRVIAATNKDLEMLVQNGTFRQDLYYRLNVAQLNLPPLRERREDIPLLISHFVRKLNAMQGKHIEGVSEDVLSILMRHPFPGNVRELENILEFSFILCPSGFIQLEHLPEHMQPGPDSQQSAGFDEGPMTLEEIKCRAVHRALERNDGRRMKTCRELGISKDTLRRMIRRCEEMGEK